MPTDTETDAADDGLLLYQMRVEAEQKAACDKFAKLCPCLDELGADTVTIAYDGYGDNGAIESVSAHRGDDEIRLDPDLASTLMDLASELMSDGWENGDGAYGQLVIDVAGRKIVREHNHRFTESEYEEEEFDL